MPIHRVLEPEVMDSPQDAEDYDRMDHAAVNRVFVADLIAAIEREFQASDSKVQVEGATRNLEPGTWNGTEDRPPLDILDVGTGTALIPVELCRRFAHCRVMAADAAVSMLELARYHLEIHSLTHRIQLDCVDAKAMPYADDMFDVVMSNSIVHHIPEPLAVVREAVRVARPGGLLFVRDLVRPQSLDELNHLVATYAADCNDHQRQLFADSLHAALSLEEIRALVASLGFAPESVQQTSDRHWTWKAVRFTNSG